MNRKTIAATLAAAGVATVLAVAPAQANTGCVNADEWGRVYAGLSKSKAQSIMGATGTRVASSTQNNSNGTHTLFEAIRYTPCSDLSGSRPTITYQELVSASWNVLIPWYVQSKYLG